jgi:hypothetical protein
MAWSQDAPPVRVRGTIERIESPIFVVKSRDGAELKIVLADNAVAVGVVKATLADVRPGSFVGIGAMPQSDGTQRALEVLIFPEAMRGTGEGHYSWDLQPKSTMTNKRARDVDRCNLINQASCTPNKMCRSQLRYARGNAQSRLSLPQL